MRRRRGRTSKQDKGEVKRPASPGAYSRLFNASDAEIPTVPTHDSSFVINSCLMSIGANDDPLLSVDRGSNLNQPTSEPEEDKNHPFMSTVTPTHLPLSRVDAPFSSPRQTHSTVRRRAPSSVPQNGKAQKLTHHSATLLSFTSMESARHQWGPTETEAQQQRGPSPTRSHQFVWRNQRYRTSRPQLAATTDAVCAARRGLGSTWFKMA